LRNARATVVGRIRNLKNLMKDTEATCGGLVSIFGSVLQALDVLNELKRAAQNDLSLWEEEKAEQQDAKVRGVHTIMSCIGPVCMFKNLDDDGEI